MLLPGISVVICTHNRVSLARNAIISVLEQGFPQDRYELLIIDNASTDATRQMAQEFCSIYPNVRYIFEPNVGLSHARNLGWREAKGQYVGYLDDDGKAAPGWLATAGEVADTIHPEAFGGPYYPFYNTPKPVWFRDEYETSTKGDLARPVQAHEYLDGGNMFIRRDLLEKHGGFRSDMGMKGTKIAYGEETLFFDILRSSKQEIVLFYHPGITIYHLVRADKMKTWLLPKRFYSLGFYSAKTRQLQEQTVFSLAVRIFRVLFQFLVDFLYGIFARDKAKYPFLQNYLYEVAFLQIWELGWAAAHFRETKEAE